jgi:hypothetical protein
LFIVVADGELDTLQETEPSPRVNIFGESLPLAPGEEGFAESKRKILGEDQNSRRTNSSSRAKKKTLGEEFLRRE